MILLIIENSDQEVYGIDTVYMTVPADFDQDYALEESGLRKPVIIEEIRIDPIKFARLSDLGFYRPFVG